MSRGPATDTSPTNPDFEPTKFHPAGVVVLWASPPAGTRPAVGLWYIVGRPQWLAHGLQ